MLPSFCIMKNGLIIFFFTGISCAFGQVDSAIYNNLVAHVHFLASDSLKGRAPGSPGEQIANTYVISRFVVNRRAKNQNWNFTVSTDSILNCRMIGSFISNKSPFTVLIGAHIDHIGMGGVLSKSPGKTAVHNGADDNASGVALLIELQRYFARRKLPFNLLLVAYTAHEIGTYGSEYLSAHWNQKKYGILAGVLNFDMIGRMDDKNRVYISCNTPADSLFDTTAFVQPVYQDQRKLELLDTKHFLDRKIPCATFSTGMHADYHKTTDDALYIHYNGLYDILRYFEDWLQNPFREKDFSGAK